MKVARTETLDATHRLVASGKDLEIPADCPEIRRFANECSRIAKQETINKRTHTPIFRYLKLSTDPDDYRHAFAYFYLAASGCRVAEVDDWMRQRGKKVANNEYDCVAV